MVTVNYENHEAGSNLMFFIAIDIFIIIMIFKRPEFENKTKQEDEIPPDAKPFGRTTILWDDTGNFSINFHTDSSKPPNHLIEL